MRIGYRDEALQSGWAEPVIAGAQIRGCLPWGRERLAEREAVGGRPVPAQLPHPVLGLVGRRMVPAGDPPQGRGASAARWNHCRRCRMISKCRPEKTNPASASTELQVVRLTITPWLPATSQPKAFTAVAFPSSVCSRHRKPDAASPSALTSSSAAMNAASCGDSSGASRRETFTCASSKDMPGPYRPVPQPDGPAGRRLPQWPGALDLRRCSLAKGQLVGASLVRSMSSRSNH